MPGVSRAALAIILWRRLLLLLLLLLFTGTRGQITPGAVRWRRPLAPGISRPCVAPWPCIRRRRGLAGARGCRHAD